MRAVPVRHIWDGGSAWEGNHSHSTLAAKAYVAISPASMAASFPVPLQMLPPLPDGRQTLVVVSDNSVNAGQFTQLIALAIDIDDS